MPVVSACLGVKVPKSARFTKIIKTTLKPTQFNEVFTVTEEDREGIHSKCGFKNQSP